MTQALKVLPDEDTRFVITDIESFGLNPERDPILEVGFLICDLEFKVIDTFDIQLWQDGVYDDALKKLRKREDKGAKIVFDMHEKSGLWNEAMANGVSPKVAEEECCQWLLDRGVVGKDPMVGSSVHFDRKFFAAQMPDVEAMFFRRNIDISSLKELCRRFNSMIYRRMPEAAPKKEAHRSLSDCMDSMNELKFYTENFLWVI